MKLVVEVDEAEYERIAAGDQLVLAGAVESVEVRQRDGLLSANRRPLLIEGLGGTPAHKLGVAPGGPAIRVILAREEEPDG